MTPSCPSHPRLSLHPNVCVLMLDIVGYVHIHRHHSDMQKAHKLLKFYAQITYFIERHNGYIIKYIGDGAIVIFGLKNSSKHALEHHVTSAIMCSEELLQRLAEPLRCAICSGSVVGGYADSQQQQYDVWGDTVDQCSRILNTTPSNTINVCHTTFSNASNLHSFSRVHHELRDFSHCDVFQYLNLGH